MADRTTLPGLLSQAAPVVDYLVNDPFRQVYNAAVPVTNFITGSQVKPVPLAGPPDDIQRFVRRIQGELGQDVPYNPNLDRAPGYTGSDTPIEVASRPVPAMVQMNQPVQPQSPAEAGIQKGSMAGLLGGAIGRMMDRSLYSTPTFGRNFIGEQASGEVALRGMESAAAQKQQENALKAAKIAADSAKANKVSLDSTQTNLVLGVAGGQKVLDTIQDAKKLIARTKLAGAGPQALQVAKNILTAMGIDPGYSDMQAYKDKVGEIQASIAQSKIFGRDLNKFDQKILAKLI